MKRTSIVAVVFVALMFVFASTSMAQTQALPGQRYSWQVDTTTLTEAQAQTYELTLDGVVSNLTGVTCTGTVKPFGCVAPIPAQAVGNRVASLRAVIVVNGVSAKSAPSNTLNYTMLAVPNAPINFSIASQRVSEGLPPLS